jgi:CRISPR/Cas system-associated exonuclease Cas4 (RecB family)
MIGEHIDHYGIEDATAGAADALSPSSVRCWFDCNFKWYCKYVLRLEDAPTSALAIGSALHQVFGENFRQKIVSKIDLPVEGVVVLFRDAWQDICRWTEFRDDEDPKALGEMSERLVRKFMSERAPSIQPAENGVEQWLSGEIGGVFIRARNDLLDENGVTDEVKSMASRRKATPMHKFQVTSYVILEPRASGKARITALVKTQTPQVIPEDWEVTAEDVKLAHELYPVAQDAMRTGLAPPNRFSVLCSRRQCSFWRRCQQEWGGEVPA